MINVEILGKFFDNHSLSIINRNLALELNKNINIPIINEKTEEKIIEAIYEVFENVMGEVIGKK